MKIQTGPSYPYLGGRLPTPPPFPTSAAPVRANPAVTPYLPILRAQKLHVFSPTTESASLSNEKMLATFRALSDLITPHLPQKVNLAVKTIWVAADAVSLYSTLNDPESSKGERVLAVADLGASALSVVGGVMNSPHLETAATGLSWAVVAGDKVHTGKFTFTQSELAGFSTESQGEDVANILKITEIFQPGTG